MIISDCALRGEECLRSSQLNTKLTERAPCAVRTPPIGPLRTRNFATAPASGEALEARKPGLSRRSGTDRPVSAPTTLLDAYVSIGTPRNPNPRPWRSLNETEKLGAAIQSAQRHGGHAFTLNLGVGREGALLHADDPSRLLSHYLSREFRRALGRDIPYSFVLEVARDMHGYDRLHVHGVVVIGDADLARVKEALIRAGGQIDHPQWAVKQLVLKPITDAAGWTSYLTKARRWHKPLPVGRHQFISREMKQLARQDYDEFVVISSMK
jgi:hypothetical protein